MKRITSLLWFDGNAEEAVRFYLGAFPHSEVVKTSYHGNQGAGRPGSVSSILFRVMGQEFTALNGGSQFKFNPAVSFVVTCKSHEEKDAIWKNLARNGKPLADGWVRDRFGLAWQIVPDAMLDGMSDAA
ncbi:MAG: hypothetical protein RLZZ385_2165 [Pseudomonadota bacterium]